MPIDTLSLVDKAELSLLRYINRNKLKLGDSIPKEIDLVDSLGVSRTVVREALARLRTLGLIQSIKHKGMVLKEPDVILNFKRVMDPNFLGDETLKDLFELRLVLEMGMCELLFTRITDTDIIELENIVDKAEATMVDRIGFSLENEVAFHGKLYQISGNQTLQRFQSILLPVFQYVHENGFLVKEPKYSRGFVTHRKLIQILKTGTPEEFRGAMKDHLEPHFNRVSS